MTLLAQPNGRARDRLGIIASRRLGGAVVRNRAKRRLREVFREKQHLVPATCDLLMIARAATVDRPITELQTRFSDACRQISTTSLSS